MSTARTTSHMAGARRRATTFVAGLVLSSAVLAGTAGRPAAAAVDVGYQGPHFSGTGTSVTGAKSESKLWFHDGAWWAVMWDEPTQDNYIFRLDVTTQQWTRTGTVLDTRAGTRADVLWNGTRLYVASHGYTTTPTSGFPTRLYRLSYNPVTDTWTRDAGFPVDINDAKSESLVIDQDATGRLWATWVQGNAVRVAASSGGDAVWGAPYVLPFTEASNLNADDISSLVAFGGDIGVMWSNQNTSTFSFATHAAGAPDSQWTLSTALTGPGMADDHINLKADGSGRVYAAVKTSRTGSSDPLNLLLVRDPGTGAWSSHVFGTVADRHTRPIVVVDETNRSVHMFATVSEVGGTVYGKSTSLDAVSFIGGLGQAFVQDGDSPDMNDATSTKQVLTSATGLVVLASNDSTRHYWHNHDALGDPPLAADFAAIPTTGIAPLTVAFDDESTGGATTWAWDFGDGATSTEQHPNHTYVGTGVYAVTLTVTDGLGQTSSLRREGFITVTAPPTSATYLPSADSSTSKTAPSRNFGGDDVLRVKNGGTNGPHYRTYLRFEVTSVPSSLDDAVLRLFVVDGSRDGGTVYPTAAGWTETGITWSNAPPPSGPALGAFGAVADGTWVELHLPPGTFAAGPGSYSFAVISEIVGAGTTLYGSRTSATAPQLVLLGGA